MKKNMKKNYTLKVKPRRFIYHVAHSNTRQSILKKGLVGCPQEINGFRNAIFAHNSVMPNYSWYPFCFDAIFDWALDSPLFEYVCDGFAYEMEKNNYVFWRIDNIPPTALKCFKFHAEPKIIRYDGVAHVQGRFRAA